RELWTRSLEGDLSILLISGEPGIGKSKLARELSTWVEAGGGHCLRGECFAEIGMPYGPFVQIMEDALGDKDLAALEIPDPVLADLASIAPSINVKITGAGANPQLDPLSEQYRLYESVLNFLNIYKEDKPLLVVLEDLHWADSSSLGLLRHLARRTRRDSICFLATYREVEIEQETTLFDLLADLNRQRLSKRMKISRLDRQETRAMLEMILGQHVSDTLLDSIFYETEGNPFFIEEVCKSLVEDGKLFQIDGRWSRVDSEELEIPQSVRLVVQNRLKKVSPDTKEILQQAAILGQVFDFEILEEASAIDPGRLRSQLRAAERAQLIQIEPAPKGERYEFAHALIPSTLARELDASILSELHGKAAGAIRSRRPDDFEALAYHYSQAGDRQLARRYFVRAANRAREIYAHEDALQFYTKALALSDDDLADRYDLLSARAKTYDLLASREQQLSDAELLLEISKELQDPQRECDALIQLADVYLVTDHPRAVHPAEKAVELARSMGDLYREGQALRQLGDQA
ncbi:MAG: AAA family ATPase, partial [Anaerolineales bacterium]|nr:AAA family ATPase [Anaerolineales bacterium]